jgi:hypothetical protein
LSCVPIYLGSDFPKEDEYTNWEDVKKEAFLTYIDAHFVSYWATAYCCVEKKQNSFWQKGAVGHVYIGDCETCFSHLECPCSFFVKCKQRELLRDNYLEDIVCSEKNVKTNSYTVAPSDSGGLHQRRTKIPVKGEAYYREAKFYKARSKEAMELTTNIPAIRCRLRQWMQNTPDQPSNGKFDVHKNPVHLAQARKVAAEIAWYVDICFMGGKAFDRAILIVSFVQPPFSKIPRKQDRYKKLEDGGTTTIYGIHIDVKPSVLEQHPILDNSNSNFESYVCDSTREDESPRAKEQARKRGIGKSPTMQP